MKIAKYPKPAKTNHAMSDKWVNLFYKSRLLLSSLLTIAKRYPSDGARYPSINIQELKNIFLQFFLSLGTRI